ncbi:YdeI/OmpD-associated family protein [Methanobrevibacter sp.]|uniref:YdeI/OmpD-associated family protein n=1 Tax=Methanobrevibacter sp. TaxID=66852 RepID=UPI00388ECE1F
METKNILDCKSPNEFRVWLEKNHASEEECWIVCKRGNPVEDTFSYRDAVYVALSFGWIDSVYGLIDGVRMQRFSPRIKKSNWSQLNRERARWLIEHELMTEAGLEVLPDDFDKEFKISRAILNRLKKDPETWENFNNFPPVYQRVKIASIQKEKKDKKLYKKKLDTFLKNTKEGKMYGSWDDYGRLA